MNPTAAGPSPSAAPASALWRAPTPRAPVSGSVALPGSKSLTNRALVLAAIADGPSTVRGALRSRDTGLMVAALDALGVEVDSSGKDWTVTPRPLSGPAEVDCGLAGTVMRFVPPVAGLGRGPVLFDGDPRARARPMGEMIAALRRLGVALHDDGRGGLPFTVIGTGGIRGGHVDIDASASSQFVSALLLAGARYDGGVEVSHVGAPLPSMPHVTMTLAALREHGVEVQSTGTSTWSVSPGPVRAVDVTVEPDLSNAAPFAAAAAVTGGRVTLPGWPTSTTQAGDRLRGLLTRMGVETELSRDGLTVSGDGQLDGVDVDLHEVGELTPAVAALAALAQTPSVLRGVAHIRGHETDRLAALATQLRELGGDVVEREDGLEIRPRRLHGGRFRTYDDHRMVHAAAILGLRVPGVLVEDVATTAKTFPGFPEEWAALVEGRAPSSAGGG